MDIDLHSSSLIISAQPCLSAQASMPSHHPGAYQLWRSLPRSSKLFLCVCIIQAIIAGAFATVELAQPGTSTIQDLVLLLLSAIYYLTMVLDAFWRENGFELLTSTAIGGVNLLQLIVYASSLRAGRDTPASLLVVAVCALLQAISLALARWAYLGFGWRMYSKFAGDMLLPDAEQRRRAGLRLHRYTALVKLDAQISSLLLVVGLVNGINPAGSHPLVPLILVAAIGISGSYVWLMICWIGITQSRSKISLMAEFTYPICYVIASSFIFSSVYYGSRIHQVHGQAYLIMFSILFITARTFVWWDARLLSSSASFTKLPNGTDFLGVNGKKNKSNQHESTPGRCGIHKAILPLVQGAWLLKLSSSSLSGGNGSSPLKAAFAGTSQRGRWRYFQLSHDGSTLRWDWRKYVLLVHVESVQCDVEELTVTLSLTLEPDLRLKFPNKEVHATWSRGLTLLVMLLGNPDGLEANKSQRISITGANMSMQSAKTGSFTKGRLLATHPTEPGSPSRLLRLASASARVSAAGLVSKEALEAAALKARKVLEECSNPSSPAGTQDCRCSQHFFIQASGEVSSSPSAVDGEKKGKRKTAEVISLTAQASNIFSPALPYPSDNRNLRQKLRQQQHSKGSAEKAAMGSLLPGLRTPPSFIVGDEEQCMKYSPEEGSSPEKRHILGRISAPFNAMTEKLQQAGYAVSKQLKFGTDVTRSYANYSNINRHEDLQETSRNSQVHGEIIYSVDRQGHPPNPESGRELHPCKGLEELSHNRNPSIGSGHMHQSSDHDIDTRKWKDVSSWSSTGGVSMAQARRSDSCISDSQLNSEVKHPAVDSNSALSQIHYGNLRIEHVDRQQKEFPGSLQRSYSLGDTAFVPKLPLQLAADSADTTLCRLSSASPYHLDRDTFAIDKTSHNMKMMNGWKACHANQKERKEPHKVDPVLAASTGDVNEPKLEDQPRQYMSFRKNDSLLIYPHFSSMIVPYGNSIASHGISVNVEMVDFDALTFGRLLGQGAEGPVYGAWFRETPVAIKRASCPSEVEVHLHAGSHDNVVNLRGLTLRGGRTYLIMELCPRGTLDVLIHQSRMPTAHNDPRKLLTIVRSIARGVFHLHTRRPPILHRDISPKNVFIGHGWVMKIGDFGMARLLSDSNVIYSNGNHQNSNGGSSNGNGSLYRTLTPGVIGTAAYCAPELLGHDVLDEHDKSLDKEEDLELLLKADVYSFGVLLYELLERKRPYAGMDGYQIQTQWLLNPDTMKLPRVHVPTGLPQFNECVLHALADLVQACTAWNPNERPTFGDILVVLRKAAGAEANNVPLASPF